MRNERERKRWTVPIIGKYVQCDNTMGERQKRKVSTLYQAINANVLVKSVKWQNIQTKQR